FSGSPVIGWSDATWLSHFNGSIDEVALYAATLSADRVSAHYSAGKGSVTTASVQPAPTSSPTPQPACSGTLQALVDGALPGATLPVPACLYRETVMVSNPLTLVGEAGTEIRGS